MENPPQPDSENPVQQETTPPTHGSWKVTDSFRRIWRKLTTPLFSVEKEFDPQRLRIVESYPSTNNLVVASSLPLDRGENFIYDKLISTINEKSVARGTGEVTAENTELIIVTLQSWFFEPVEHLAIRKGIRDEISQGRDIQHIMAPLAGALTSPAWIPACLKSPMRLPQNYMTYVSLPKLIRQIVTLANTQTTSGKRRIIAFHCAHGVDRTGLVEGSYRMYRGESYSETVTRINYWSKFKGQSQGKNYKSVDFYVRNGLKHFAEHLKYNEKTTRDGTTPIQAGTNPYETSLGELPWEMSAYSVYGTKVN